MAKRAAKDIKSTADAKSDPSVTHSAADAAAGSNAVDATAGGSTAAAVIDTRGGKTANSDSGASDTAQAAALPADPSANQPIAAPQAVAVAIGAAVIPAAPTTTGSGSGGDSDGGTGQDAAQIAASSDAVKAGAQRGKAGAEATAKGGGTTADARGTQPDAKTADAATSTPSLTPQPTQRDLISPTSPGQPKAADGPQSRNADMVPATAAATNQARQHAVTSQPTNGTAGPQGNSNGNSNGNSSLDPNVDPKRDPNGSANRIEDITRQALDTTVQRLEAPAAETAGSATSQPDSVPAGSAQQAPDGSSGLVAPAIPAAAAVAPTAATLTTATATAIPIAGLAVEIASHAQAGKNRFEIRLDPPEFGRIDVRLDVDREGKVTSRLVVDRPETLDILRRDAPELERSLQQAGLTTADNALQFTLRDHGGFGGQNPYPDNGSPTDATRVIIPDRELPPVDATTVGYGRVIGTSTGLDIRV